MGNLPRIILTIVAVTAIFLWVTTAFNACGSNETTLIDESTEFVDDSDDTQAFLDEEGDEIFDDIDEDGEEFYIEEDDTEVEYVDEPEDTDFTTPPEVVRQAPAQKPSRPATVNRGNSSGEFMIIAGNYLVESNAGEMSRKLSNLGYNNAEIAVFDYSQYHTVIASRHNSYSDALETANAIKRQGVDCYVKRKQY